MKKFFLMMMMMVVLGFVFAGASPAEAGEKYKVAWSHYTGWEPWEYADHSGILKKWADKYGIEIELVLVNDYIESINQYTSGIFDACVMTNMDALTIPAMGGIDSTALIVGDYSNGNDGIVAQDGTMDIKGLKGKQISLVELSVTHYLMARAFYMNGIGERDVTIVNTSDADIGSLFASGQAQITGTWNPILMKVRQAPKARLLFDSSMIPGEILDLMVVHTSASDSLKKALVGAWYETMQVMSGSDAKAKASIQYMAQFAGASEAEFRAQLKTTRMYYTPAEAVKFTEGTELTKVMDYVRQFCQGHGLYPQGSSLDYVGIQFPNGSVLGSPKNVKLRFDSKFMKMAADGQL